MLLSLCLLFVFLVDCLLIFFVLCMDEDKEPSFVVNFYIVSKKPWNSFLINDFVLLRLHDNDRISQTSRTNRQVTVVLGKVRFSLLGR